MLWFDCQDGWLKNLLIKIELDLMSESEYSAQRSTKNTKTSKQQKCKGKRIQTRNQIYSAQNHKRRERTKANCAQVSREFQQRTFLNNDYLIRNSKNWRWVENSKTPPPSLSWGVPSLMHLCCFVKHTSIYFILFCKATLKDGLPPLPLRLHNPLFKHTFILSACTRYQRFTQGFYATEISCWLVSYI